MYRKMPRNVVTCKMDTAMREVRVMGGLWCCIQCSVVHLWATTTWKQLSTCGLRANIFMYE